MVTYLADGTVTGHDTLKETGGVSTKKKNQSRREVDGCDLPSTIELQLAPFRPEMRL